MQRTQLIFSSTIIHHSPEAGQSAQLACLAHGVVGGDPVVPPALDVASHDVVTYLGLALVSSI